MTRSDREFPERVDGPPEYSDPAANVSEHPLWSMRKGNSRIDCRIRLESATRRWGLVLVQETRSLWCHWFESWAEAIAAADDKHALLEKRGWTASAAMIAEPPTTM